MKRFGVNSALVAAVFGAAALSACSGNSSSSPGIPTTKTTPLPVLVPGSQFTYAGSFSETIAYASPSPQQPNSHGEYATTDVEKVSTAASGAPGPIEVVRRLRYRVKHAPVSGLQPQQRTIDSYESSTLANGSQTIDLLQTTTTTTGIDQSANRQRNNGPYTYKGSDTTKYAAAHVLQVFPLVPGSTQEPLARTVIAQFVAQNAGGSLFAQRDTTTNVTDTGAYTESGTIAPGVTTSVNAYANGTAHLNNVGTSPLIEKI